MAACSLTSSSRRSYAAAMLKLQVFASLVAVPHWFPSSLALLLAFIPYLVDLRLAHATIRSMFSAISFYHLFYGHSDPTTHFLIKKALLFDAKRRPASDSRLPVTPHILQQLLLAVEQVFLSPRNVALYQSLFTLMFFAFLRMSEVASGPHTLHLRHVTWSSKSLTIAFPSYKHSRGPLPSIVLYATASHLCPVRAFLRYISFRSMAPGPLFMDVSGLPLTSSAISQSLKTCLAFAGYSSLPITSHSFRIGAASWAAANGHSSERIRLMGRWKSDAFRKYIRIPSISLHSHVLDPR